MLVTGPDEPCWLSLILAWNSITASVALMYATLPRSRHEPEGCQAAPRTNYCLLFILHSPKGYVGHKRRIGPELSLVEWYY
ncbi:hypothetical protein BD410DRAFT_30284 [Rickenella mellea]|uniref:Uncharacterized protein n=1 Tax=Rickenella mellea TaxID=50990 RepID=A0A4R5XH69_9AGAM|nr:hypothetical protein BD410DRAFT_30284 [Rickenella mellea]